MMITSNGHDTHLAFRSDTRPDERWETHFAGLRRQLPRVRAALALSDPAAANEPVAIGLGLSMHALAALERPSTLARLRAWLDEAHCRIRTIDVIADHTAARERPGGEDGGRVVRPRPGELDRASRLVALLARLVPPGAQGSVGVRCGAYARSSDQAHRQAIVESLLRGVARCVALEREGGVRISLALAPHPERVRETSIETVDFIESEVLATRPVQRLAALADLSAPDSRRALHRHVGLWHDVCRSAVAFLTPSAPLDACAAAGIGIVRLRLGSALRLEDVNEATLRQLVRSLGADSLCRVVERRGALIVNHVDLGVAIEAARYRLERRSTLDASTRVPIGAGAGAGVLRLPAVIEPASEWHVDVPVPVRSERAGPFSTTQSALLAVLSHQRESGLCPHLELRSGIGEAPPGLLGELPPAIALARELEWIRARL